ncbi:ArsR family transcriptional regulator [Candidatus Kryptonium thompsonii]|jgi:ArsR family transcriptional regulator|uniref:ArsR family transcriptional regulator n=1 Tax=Candidatus Kryptonium thompsonii TaxID=1633631 RepID=A0A0N7MQ95_9BACT|nr:metalloregulator ArsR/SmtB family transcription factor [Candidatus Kryptonium thompsoni]CUS77104.1 ArsR family transcriptional regulator [Candidatus Kryptonium thompsoni]CUS79533.1 ArsR family transcriptional regulator [Candidatus Kryptonium thompsoni]CUS81219.1 ArsR family transcriptional regulator [Candidatus Kryptonium thompsoni]CUS85374.1 ArsR family transcriptional regulator [Candidatus Kryptonium thompsoni]CUS87678.1 ArsR family transcriptional regulator [Candidatus Kryptonium thompso
MRKYTEILKAISDEKRLRILRTLIKSKTGMCVCELMDTLGEQPYNISRNLKILQFLGLVEGRREGKWVVYSAVQSRDEFLKYVIKAIDSIPNEFFREDDLRMKLRLNLRQAGRCVYGVNSRAWNEAVKKIYKQIL